MNESLKKAIKKIKVALLQKEKSNFSCLECENQHRQILNWFIELSDYENGKIGNNLEDPTISGYLSLDEAIEHTKDIIDNTTNKQIKNEHKQLLNFLQKLQIYRTIHDEQHNKKR